ncbi:MAG: OmpA family protein [Polyangiaceae bacterium]|nr:OmpA family protein [Polyangiaceae bacterium]
MFQRAIALACSSCVCLWAGGVAAQSAGGFALNRFDPSERGSEWFVSDTLDFRGNGRVALGVVGDWAHKPLVVYDAQGDEVAPVVEDQVFAHLGLSWVIAERLRLAANLPLALVQQGQDQAVGATQLNVKNGAGLGDLRFAADVRLAGAYRDPASLALGVRVFTPTGDRAAYTSDGTLRLLPELLFAGELGSFAYAARAGFQYRPHDSAFAGVPMGNEVVLGAAAGLRLLEGHLVVGPELFGTTNVQVSSAAFDRKTTPFEVLFGGHYKTDSGVRVGMGAGPGLTRGLGAPKFRGLLSLEWLTEPEQPKVPREAPPSDRDHDGIADTEDACPDEEGIRTDDSRTNGCPVPGDRDGDGVIDANDACVDEAGVRTEDPKTNGCPKPKDRDLDGVLDVDDACVDEPGVKTDDPKTNGCPPPKDTDGDKILDPDDACVDQAGPPNKDTKKHGCPMAVVQNEQIIILQRVEFENNKAVIRPESENVLKAVFDVLSKHPEILKISVEGHTDDRGADQHNKRLSEARAKAVVAWLVAKGIQAERLESRGFGEEKPIDTNTTDEGRQNNRRVEFHITKKSEL